MMRKIGRIIPFILLSISMAYGYQAELAPVLNGWGLSPSETAVIEAIFRDGIEKKVEPKEMLDSLKEAKLKKFSFYDSSIELMKKVKLIAEIGSLDIPYADDGEMKKYAYYLGQMLNIPQMENLYREMKEKKMPKTQVKSVYELMFFLNSKGVPVSENYQAVYLMVKTGQAGPGDLEQVKNAVLKSANLKKSPPEIVSLIKNGLLKGKTLKVILYEMEKK